MEASLSDSELVVRTREGDASAFGELWSRHYAAGIRAARAVTSSQDPEDLVQDSFTKIFEAIRKGDGPRGAAFRSYLITTIRNAATSWARASKEVAVDSFEETPDPFTSDAEATRRIDREFAARAFYMLPARWQEVLWYTEIERMKPQDVARLLGMSSLSVRQLSFRARGGLKDAWVGAHLHSTAEKGTECRWSVERLGPAARSRLGPRGSARLEAHLKHCRDCARVAQEASDVVKSLPLAVLPLLIGAPGAVAYLSSALADPPTATAEWKTPPEGVHGTARELAADSLKSAGSFGGGRRRTPSHSTMRGSGSAAVTRSLPHNLLVPSVASTALAVVVALAAVIPPAFMDPPAQVTTTARASDSGEDYSFQEAPSLDEAPITDELEDTLPETGETPQPPRNAPKANDHAPTAPRASIVTAVPPVPQATDELPGTPAEPPQVKATRVFLGKYSDPMPTADADGMVIQVDYEIAGTSGATVRSHIDGEHIGDTTLVAGASYVRLALTKDQYCGRLPVSFAYVEKDQLGTPTTVVLAKISTSYCSS